MRRGDRQQIKWQRSIGAGVSAMFFASSIMAAEASFKWEWRHSQYLTQTLRTAKVTSAERLAIARAIAGQGEAQTSEMKFGGVESKPQLPDAVLDTPVELVDLNGDGVPEVIAQGNNEEGCSPTGNCPFWIFQKSGPGYMLLVHLGAIQTFQIQRSRSEGFKDIVVEMHGSATMRGLWLLRFDHGKYRKTNCYDANWTVLEGDTVCQLKEPLVTPCKGK